MPIKYVDREYKVGQRYLVDEPLAKYYGKIITISRVEEEYYMNSFGPDVYYTVVGNKYQEYGFQVHSIFEQGLKNIPL